MYSTLARPKIVLKMCYINQTWFDLIWCLLALDSIDTSKYWNWIIVTVIACCWFYFCSVKFMDKIRYVHTLEELSQIIPMEHVQIPECVLQWVLWASKGHCWHTKHGCHRLCYVCMLSVIIPSAHRTVMDLHLSKAVLNSLIFSLCNAFMLLFLDGKLVDKILSAE